MTRDRPDERATPAGVVAGYAAVWAALAAMLALWTLMAPPLSTADEPAHVNSVLRLLQGGGWPAPHEARMVEGMYVATQEAGSPFPESEPLERLPEPAERSVVTPLDAESVDGRERLDWMTQHPPTWYALQAGVLSVLGADDWRWDQQLLAIRLTGAALVAAGIGFAMAATRRLSGSHAAALLSGLAVFTVTQFFGINGLATNDTLVVLAGSALVYFLSRVLAPSGPGVPWRAALGAGLALGLALITKGTMLSAVPVVGVILLVVGIRAAERWPARLLPAAIGMATAFAVGGWYYVRNLLLFGRVQSTVNDSDLDPEPVDGFDVGEWLGASMTYVGQSFWGSVREVSALPGWWLISLVVLLLVSLVVVLWRAPRRGAIALLLLLPLAMLALLLYGSWVFWWNEGRIRGMQGRYFFGEIAVYGAVLAVAWLCVFGHARRAVRAASAAIVACVFLAAAMGGWLLVFARRWLSADAALADGIRDMTAAGAATPAFAIACLAVGVAAGAAGVVLTARTAARERVAASGPALWENR